jgi:hypothetical protein
MWIERFAKPVDPAAGRGFARTKNPPHPTPAARESRRGAGFGSRRDRKGSRDRRELGLRAKRLEKTCVLNRSKHEKGRYAAASLLCGLCFLCALVSAAGQLVCELM